MAAQKLAFRPVPLQQPRPALPSTDMAKYRSAPSSPTSSSNTSSSSKRRVRSFDDSEEENASSNSDDSAESDGEDVDPRLLSQLSSLLQQQRSKRASQSNVLQAPAGVQRASRMAAAQPPSHRIQVEAYGTRTQVLESLGLDSKDAHSIPYEELVQMCETRHQKSGRTGWQRGSGLRITDPQERRAGERCVLLRTQVALMCNFPWLLPNDAAPYMHSERLDRCFHINALSNGRTKRGKREGASTQVSRIDKSRVSRSEAAACAATMLEMALIRHHKRISQGALVLSPLASNAFDLGGALGVTSKASNVLVVGSALLPYNCMPVQLATGDAYDAALTVARAQLEDRAITVALGNLSTHLDAICLSIANPDHVDAEFDCCWAAIVLMAHLSHHPLGIALISKLAPRMTNFQLERMRSLESYGRTEILRRINQANREFNKQQKGASSGGKGARKAPRVVKEEGDGDDDVVAEGLVADRATLGDPSISDMRFWTWALRSPHASCLATLIAGSEDTARDAAMRTLHKQAPGSNILYNKTVTDAAEDHAVSVNAEMDGIILRKKKKLCRLGPVPRFLRFVTAVAPEQKLIAQGFGGKRINMLSGHSIQCHVVEAFGMQKLPDDSSCTTVHVARRVVPGSHPTAPSGCLASQRIAILHSLASRPLRSPSDEAHLPAFCERTAIRSAIRLATQDERSGSTFGTGKGKMAAETARIKRQLEMSNTDDSAKMLLTSVTGLTRSWISTRTFVHRSELNGLTPGSVLCAAIQKQMDEPAATSNASDAPDAPPPLAEAVARGGGCMPVGERVAIRGDPGRRGRMQHPESTRHGLALRIDQIVRNAFRQTPNPTQRGARPCRTLMLEPVKCGLSVCTNDAPVDHYAPPAFAALCETDVEFDGKSWSECPERLFGPADGVDKLDDYVPAIAWKQLCADGAVRIVDVVARGMRMRLGQYTIDAEAGDDQPEEERKQFEAEEQVWKSAVLEGGDEICYDDVTRGLAHLLLAAASQASLISDFGESIAGQHMIVFVANSRGVRVPDNCFVANLTVYDALYAHRTGLEPQCCGTRYEGQYGAIYDDGRCSMGIAAHNHVSDNRLHGSGHLSQSFADACAMRLGSRKYAIHYTKEGTPVHRPPETCGEPHGIIPGVHRALEHYVGALELVRKRILRRTDDGVSEILLPSTGPYSQQLDPDSEPGCALVQAARGTRVGSAKAVEEGRMPLADSTDERLALLREPLFRRPQRTQQQYNFFEKSYDYATTFHGAAALLSQIAVLASTSNGLHECNDAEESKRIAKEIVQSLHGGLCNWHSGAQEDTRSHCLLYSICMILLGCMYPASWTIGKRMLPYCYGRAAAICARRLDHRIRTHGKEVEVEQAQTLDEEGEEGEDDADDEWEEVGVPPCDDGVDGVDGYSLKQLLEGEGEDPELLEDAKKRWSAFCRADAPNRCAWQAGVAPLLECMIANNGAPPACPQEIDRLRTCLENAVQAAWLVHSPDGFQRPPATCPCSDVDFGKIRTYHIKQVYVGGLNGQPADPRTGLVGMRAFQFRQVLMLLMGAHLKRVDPDMKEEVNVVANDGQLCERNSSNPWAEGEHGDERTIKAISPAQCDRDTDCFGTREERKRVCRAQMEAYDLNFQLLEPAYLHLQDPLPIKTRMRGRSGECDIMQAMVRSNAASNAETTSWERDAEYLLSKASMSEASAQSIHALHR